MSTLEEKSIIAALVVDMETGDISVKRAAIITRDGEVIAKEYHRKVVQKGDDLTDEESIVKQIAALIWERE